MRKTDYGIRDRCAEELRQFGSTPKAISESTGFVPQLVRVWLDGEATPSAASLARFHELGMNVIYILTGGDKQCTT
jgi:hypothetical protein